MFVAAFWSIALGAGGVGAQTQPGWTSFQGGPAHPGTATEAVFTPPLHRVWQARASATDARLSAAAVMPGLAVATGTTSVIGLDPATGSVSWSRERAQGALVTPAIDPAFGTHGLIVYLEGAGSTSAVVAVDPSDPRRLVWRAVLDDSAMGSPAIDAGRVFVGGRDQSVVAVDEASGHVIWKTHTAGPVDAPPAASGGAVYAVSESPLAGGAVHAHLYALDAATGRVAWSYEAPRPSEHSTAPTVAGGRVFVGFGDVTARAFDAATGKLMWRAPVRGDFEAVSSPAYSDEGLFLEDAEGSMYRLDARTGRRMWDFQFSSLSQSGAPLVARGTVYGGLDDGSVAALDASSGHLVWRTTLRFGPIGALASAGDLLLAPTVGPGGGIAAFGNDPTRELKDIRSPTELHLGVALADFAGAFVLMLAFVYGLFAVLARRVAARQASGPGTPEGADGGDEEP